MKKQSKKTTAGAIVALLGAIIAIAAVLTDGNPETVIDQEHIGALMVAGGAVFGMFFARDHDVSSKAAGVEGEEKPKA